MSGKYFQQLDGLRCIAVTLVLFQHWMAKSYWASMVGLGQVGVNLFFVISGFLITRILLGSKEKQALGERTIGMSMKTFYGRRFLRIFPVYYFVLLMTFIPFPGIIRESLPWNATFTTNILIMLKGDWVGAVSHYWSLAVEEQFYLFMPLLLFLIPRGKILRVLYGMLAIGLLSRIVMWFMGYPFPVIYVATPCCLDILGAGGILAYYYEYRREWLLRVSGRYHREMWWLGVLSLLSFLSIEIFGLQNFIHVVLSRTILSLFFFLLVCKTIFEWSGKWGRFLEHPFIVYLGKTSYSAYLLHNFVPKLLFWAPLPENVFARFMIYWVVLLILSTITWKLIELPVLRFKKHLSY